MSDEAKRYDAKQFLELLHPYRSEETKKARRNLSAIAFVIVAVRLLGLRLADIRVFGADLSRSAEIWVLILAMLLLAYWLVMFLLTWFQDREIQTERTSLMEAQIQPLVAHYSKLEEERRKNPNYYASDFKQVEIAVLAYREQQKRTGRAAKVGELIKKLEFFVPLSLYVVAAFVLAVDMRALLK